MNLIEVAAIKDTEIVAFTIVLIRFLNQLIFNRSYAMAPEKGNYRHERRNQSGRFRGQVLNTKQSNLKFDKLLLQK